MMNGENLKHAQRAAKRASDRMLEALMGFEPCDDLKVADVKFISEWARTIAFDAIKDYREAPVSGTI